jgi:uncharacterized protein YecE (DUF72 family)
MQILAGTSGYAYKHWTGHFYPEGLPQSGMLRWYAGRLPTVEINNTFYRMPAVALLERWREEVPPGFTFSVKAPRYITHVRRLKDAESSVAELARRTAALGDKLGATLFQLPPTLRKDLPLLRGFLGGLPAGRQVAIEFRHDSWQDEEVHEALREHAAALCVTEDDEGGAPFVCTADCAYLRLRRTRYDESDLASWVDRLAAQPLARAYVYFKHEDEALATRFALDLLRIGGARGPA